MHERIIARLNPRRIWMLVPLPAVLVLPQLVRLLWEPSWDISDLAVWSLALIVALMMGFGAIRLRLRLRKNGGAMVWIEDDAVHTLDWKQSIALKDIQDVRIARAIGQPDTVMLVLHDGRIREISDAALSSRVAEIAERIRASLPVQARRPPLS